MNRVDPWGEERADYRAGIIASVFANCHRTGNQDRFKPSDFVFEYRPVSVEQTPEEIDAAIDAAFGPKVLP